MVLPLLQLETKRGQEDQACARNYPAHAPPPALFFDIAPEPAEQQASGLNNAASVPDEAIRLPDHVSLTRTLLFVRVLKREMPEEHPLGRPVRQRRDGCDAGVTRVDVEAVVCTRWLRKPQMVTLSVSSTSIASAGRQSANPSRSLRLAPLTSPSRDRSAQHCGSAAKRCPRPSGRRGHRAAPQLAVRVPP